MSKPKAIKGLRKETQEIKKEPKFMAEIREGLKAIQNRKIKKYTSLNELFDPT